MSRRIKLSIKSVDGEENVINREISSDLPAFATPTDFLTSFIRDLGSFGINISQEDIKALLPQKEVTEEEEDEKQEG